MPAWAADDPRAFWLADDAGERANGNLYHELEFALPVELTREQQLAAAREFVHVVAGERHPYEFALHDKPGNPHIHFMFSGRLVDSVDQMPGPEKFFRRPEKGGCRKLDIFTDDWLKDRRRDWQDIANRHLAAAGLDARIDHRSYKDRGIDKAPGVHLGRKAHRLEKAGKVTWRGNKNRGAAHLNASLLDVQSQINQKENRNGKRHGRPGKPHAQQQHRAGVGGTAAAPKRAFAAWNDRGADRPGLRASEHLGPQRMPALRHSRAGHGQQEPRDAVLQRPVSGHRDGNHRLHGIPGGGLYTVEALDRRQIYKARLLQERYQQEIATALAARLAYVDRQPDRIAITLKGGGSVIDHGDRLLTKSGRDQEILAGILLATAKGWKTISLTGSADFKARAWLEIARAGLQVAGYEPSPDFRAQLEKERKAMLGTAGGASLTPDATPDHQGNAAVRRWGDALERARRALLDEHKVAQARLVELHEIDIKKLEKELAAEHGGAEYRAARQTFKEADAKAKAAGVLTRKRAEAQREKAWQAFGAVHDRALAAPAAAQRLAAAQRQNREREQVTASLTPIKIGIGEIEQWQRQVQKGRNPEAEFAQVWQQRKLKPLQRWQVLAIAPVFEADAAGERARLQAEAEAAEFLKAQARQEQAQREIAAQQQADGLLDLLSKPGLTAAQEEALQEQHRYYTALANGSDEAEARERAANPNVAPRPI